MRTCWRNDLPLSRWRRPNVTCCGHTAAKLSHISGQVSQSRGPQRNRSCRVGAQTEMTLEPRKRTEILKAIKKLGFANHINVAGVDYAVWAKHLDELTPELLNADLASFEAGTRQLLTELKTSHTVFYHSLPKELLPQHTINASLKDVAQ